MISKNETFDAKLILGCVNLCLHSSLWFSCSYLSVNRVFSIDLLHHLLEEHILKVFVELFIMFYWEIVLWFAGRDLGWLAWTKIKVREAGDLAIALLWLLSESMIGVLKAVFEMALDWTKLFPWLLAGQSQAILFVQYFFLQPLLFHTFVLNVIFLDFISDFRKFDFSSCCLLDILSDEDVIQCVPFPQFSHYLIKLFLLTDVFPLNSLDAVGFRGKIEQFEHVRRNKNNRLSSN